MRGRLHTRYAPVRRSSAQYCYRLLPLDLHVLSLPLAFILSQDQTLHCKNCSFYLLDSSSCLIHICYMYADTRYLFLLIRFKQLSFSGRKRLQKYNLFSFRQNIFSKKIVRRAELAINQRSPRQRFFAAPRRGVPQNGIRHRPNRQKKPPSGQKRGFSGENRYILLSYSAMRRNNTTVSRTWPSGCPSPCRRAPCTRPPPGRAGRGSEARGRKKSNMRCRFFTY